jgi:hypothetical protein
MLFTDLKNIEIDGATVVLRSAVNVGEERIVHLDQTTHTGAAFTNDGHSIGRWDNGTLVVDTRNFSDHPFGNRGGVPSGAEKHLVEYFELYSRTRNILRRRSKAPRSGSIGPICPTRRRNATSRTRADISKALRRTSSVLRSQLRRMRRSSAAGNARACSRPSAAATAK